MSKNFHQASRPAWFTRRGYLHFDHPVGLGVAEKIVANPDRVARHSFFPFIRYEILSFKVKSNDDGALQSKEKVRPIAYASHLDAHIYSYYSANLAQCYEEELKVRGIAENVTAFRSLGKSNIEFAKQAFDKIEEKWTPKIGHSLK